MKKTIAVLPGDGVGPEVIKQGIKILDKIASKFGHTFSYQYGDIGATAIDKTGNPLPDNTLNLCENSDAVLFGAIGDPKYDFDLKTKVRPEQGLLKLCKSLGLFANLRPIKTYEKLASSSPLKNERIEGVDFIVVRELTGGIYFGTPSERRDRGETAVDTSIYSKLQITNIAKIAIKLALMRKKSVVSVDKANVLETSRLWRETVTEILGHHKEITLTHMYVDNAAMQIIKNPANFDIILTENMFGDILMDEASVITGSIAMIPSASIGEKISLYEPIHGAYNKAAGQNTANPIAAILSTALMLKNSFGLETEGNTVEKAVEFAINDGFRTKDIADSISDRQKILGTNEMGDKIIQYIS